MLRMAIPAGITTKAGPGIKISMMPNNSTMDPAINTAIFRMVLYII